MSSCFFSGCREDVQYMCKCRTPEIRMCLTHMGNHYAAKCGMSPLHVDLPASNPLIRTLGYLEEVKKSILVSYSSVLVMLKNEVKRMLGAVQGEENKIKGFLAGRQTLSAAERAGLESKKLFSLRIALDEFLADCKDTVTEVNDNISKHLALSYRPEKDYRVNWGSIKLTEMNKAGYDLSCAKCSTVKTHQEMIPIDPGTFCSICLGGTQGYDFFISPPQWGGPPPHDFHEKKKKHGHGHGHHDREHDHHWKRKHHRGPPPEMTFCPPHLRPRCPYYQP